MKFTIITPYYNSEKYLERCIDSVLAQDYDNYELILVSDHPEDSSDQIAEKYTSNPRVRLIKNEENMGVSESRNRGLREVTGDWVLFLDSDDMIESTALSQIKKDIEKSEDTADVFIYNLMIDKNGKSFRYADMEEYKIEDKKELADITIAYDYGVQKYHVMTNTRCIGGKVYRAELIKKTEVSFDTELSTFEDAIFNLYLYNAATSVISDKKGWYHYNKDNEQSISTVFKPELVNQYRRVLRKMRQYNRQTDYVNREAYIQLIYSLFSLVIFKASTEELDESKETRKELIAKLLKEKGLWFGMKYADKNYMSKREKARYYIILLRKPTLVIAGMKKLKQAL